MSTNGPDDSTVERIAGLLLKDIGKRSLHEGDPYLTAAEASKLLGVSPMMANRAMNVLAEREILVRRRRRGTFVGSGMRAAEPNIAAIHLVGFMDDDPEWAPPFGKMLVGLRRSVPAARITMHHLPFKGALRHYREVVEQVVESHSFHGIILSYAPREVQEYTTKECLPAVVYGTPFPGVRLPCVETDQKEVGRLMVQEAAAAGARRLFVLTREHWRHGDTLAFDGILTAAHEAGMSPNDLRVRNFDLGSPFTEAGLRPLIEEVVRTSQIPTGLLCRSPQITRIVNTLVSRVNSGADVSHLSIIGAGDAAPDSLITGPVVRTVGCSRSVEERFAALGRVLNGWKQLASKTVPESTIPDSTIMGAVVLSHDDETRS